jgi:hypothetical protein
MIKKTYIYLFVLFLILSILACGNAKEIISTQPAESESEPIPEQPEETESVQPPSQPEPPKSQKMISAEVENVNWYISSIDSLWFIGLVKNTGNVDLEFVEINVLLRDGEGTLVASDFTYSELDTIPVGEYSPFTVLFLEEPESWEKYEVVVEGEEAGFLTPYTEFEIISANGKQGSFGDYEIVGEIRNTGSQDAEFVEISAALYDINGKLIGVDFTYTDFDKVVAGGSSPFTIMFLSTADGDPDHFELFIEGSISE